MGRKAANVTEQELRDIVAKLEGTVEQGKKKTKGKKSDHAPLPVSPFSTRSALFEAIRQSDWGKAKIADGVPLTLPNLYNWIVVKHKIPLITPVGKKGRQKGVKVGGGKRKKSFNQTYYDAAIKQLENQGERANTPRNRTLVQKVANGSRNAAITAKCKDCCGHERGVNVLIRECTSTSCALWPFRPFQTSDNEPDDSGEPEVVQIALPAPVAAVA